MTRKRLTYEEFKRLNKTQDITVHWATSFCVITDHFPKREHLGGMERYCEDEPYVYLNYWDAWADLCKRKNTDKL